MIYFFYGENQPEKKKALAELLESQGFESSNLPFVIGNDNWSESALEEHALNSGLFAAKNAIVLENIFVNKDAKDFILEKISVLKDSGNVFIFLELKAPKEILSLFKKEAESVVSFEPEHTGAVGREFNIFSLTDAFGKRDRKEAWIIFQKALSAEVAAEEIQGILFWQIKSMILSKDKKADDMTIKETGLNPFVFKKSAAYSKNFNSEELKNLSSNIVLLYHDAHRGLLDLNIGLEKFILESL